MHFNLPALRAIRGCALIFLCATIQSCSVYIIDKDQLQNHLYSAENCCKTGGLNKLLSTYKVQYNNKLDSISYFDATGKRFSRRLKYDTRLKVVTRSKGAIWFYAKTLYIWKGEYLVGECSEVRIKNTGYLPVKLSDISRIEVRG